MVELLAGFKVYWLSVLTLFSFLWGSYVFYRKTVESNFNENNVFDLILLSALFSFIFSRVVFVLNNLGLLKDNWLRIFLIVEYPGFSIWGVPLAVFLVTLVMRRKLRGDMFDWFDFESLGWVSGLLVAKIGAVFLLDGVRIFGLIPVSLVEVILLTLLYWVLWYLEKEYRMFDWYRYSKTEARSGLVFATGIIGGVLIQMLMMIWYGYSVIKIITMVASIVAAVWVVYTRSGKLVFFKKNDFKK